MTVAPQTTGRDRPTGGYRHECVVHHGDQGFLDLAVPFVLDAVVAGEPVLVAVSPARIDLLRDALGPGTADAVRFADMTVLGRNPARIIPAWRGFVDAHRGRPVRGIGQPVWAGRPPAEQAEALLHEALLDLAFPDDPPLWLRCPYDAASLPVDVLAAGRDRHPTADPLAEFGGPLPPPDPAAETVTFRRLTEVRGVRNLVGERATAWGLDAERTADLLIAVHEIAVNSLRHGGDRGTLRLWRAGDALVCEVTDGGHIAQPLVGRVRPLPTQLSGRGVWLANQLCDLVQLRSAATGTTVRLHMDLPTAPTAPPTAPPAEAGPSAAAAPPAQAAPPPAP